jgi:hypothetical protein
MTLNVCVNLLKIHNERLFPKFLFSFWCNFKAKGDIILQFGVNKTIQGSFSYFLGLNRTVVYTEGEISAKNLTKICQIPKFHGQFEIFWTKKRGLIGSGPNSANILGRTILTQLRY